MNRLREKVLKAHRALLNGSGELAYFEARAIAEQVVRGAFVGYESGAFLYPCRAKGGHLLGLHYKGKARDAKGKRRQWWGGYAEDLPPKGHGNKPDAPAKVIPFGMETLEGLEVTCGLLMDSLKPPLAFSHSATTQPLDVFGRVDSPPVFVPLCSRNGTKALSEAKP